MNRARFIPFGLFRHSNAVNNEEDDEISSRSYNFMGEDDPTILDQLINRSNGLRNFDDYEALLNLDDNII